MPNYNILRTEKVKDRKQITSTAEHNFRLRTQDNIDASRTHKNKVLVNKLAVDVKKASDLQEKLTAHYEALGVKEKKDNVLMMEFIVSASPEFFNGKKEAGIDAWAMHQVAFFEKQFGQQLQIAVLHLDETTPHLHFMVSTEVKSIKRYKNQRGEFHKETWSLNANRINPEFLRDLHDKHADWNKKFGLIRGREGSMRQHKSLKDFYEVVDKALKVDYETSIEKTIAGLETGFLSGKVDVAEIRKKLKPTINALLKQNKALQASYKVNFKQWADDLQKIEDEMKEERADIDGMRPIYLQAIREKTLHTKLLAELEDENTALNAEIRRLKTTYEPDPVAPNAPTGRQGKTLRNGGFKPIGVGGRSSRG